MVEFVRASQFHPRAAARALEPAQWPQSIAARGRPGLLRAIEFERRRPGAGGGGGGWGLGVGVAGVVGPESPGIWLWASGLRFVAASPFINPASASSIGTSLPACTSLTNPISGGTEAAARSVNP